MMTPVLRRTVSPLKLITPVVRSIFTMIKGLIITCGYIIPGTGNCSWKVTRISPVFTRLIEDTTTSYPGFALGPRLTAINFSLDQSTPPVGTFPAMGPLTRSQ